MSHGMVQLGLLPAFVAASASGLGHDRSGHRKTSRSAERRGSERLASSSEASKSSSAVLSSRSGFENASNCCLWSSLLTSHALFSCHFQAICQSSSSATSAAASSSSFRQKNHSVRAVKTWEAQLLYVYTGLPKNNNWQI